MISLPCTAEEIQDALDTMDTPAFCPFCLEFYDTNSRECPGCGGDDLDNEIEYHLELALERESMKETS